MNASRTVFVTHRGSNSGARPSNRHGPSGSSWWRSLAGTIVRMGWPRQSFAYRRTRSIVGSVDCDRLLVFVRLVLVCPPVSGVVFVSSRAFASTPSASEDEPSGRCFAGLT